MKKLVGVLGTLALVVSVMPTATAEQGVEENARDLTIDVTGTAVPASLGELIYPYYAAERGMAGECSMELSVDEAGEATSYQIRECSHATFRRAAESFARTLNYAPAEAASTQELTVSWGADS